jgi:hypothetical protein
MGKGELPDRREINMDTFFLKYVSVQNISDMLLLS